MNAIFDIPPPKTIISGSSTLQTIESPLAKCSTYLLRAKIHWSSFVLKPSIISCESNFFSNLKLKTDEKPGPEI